MIESLLSISIITITYLIVGYLIAYITFKVYAYCNLYQRGLVNTVYPPILLILLFWPIAFIVIPIGYLIHLEYEQNHDNEI